MNSPWNNTFTTPTSEECLSMRAEESPELLQPGLILSKGHKPYPSKTIDNFQLCLFKVNRMGIVTAYPENSDCIVVSTQEELVRLFTRRKYTFIHSQFNEMDCVLNAIDKSNIDLLLITNFIDFSIGASNYRLRWIPGSGIMSLNKDGNTRNTNYLINLGVSTVKGTVVNTYEGLRDIILKQSILDNFTPVLHNSMASIAKNYTLHIAGREFEITNKLDMDELQFMRNCYKGPRMESRYLGTLDGRENIDMNKAYLNALKEIPALYQNISKRIRHSKTIYDNAHPMSCYKVLVDVPMTYDTFSPFSIRTGGRLQYPHGEFVTNLTKNDMDLLNELGDIPYTILDSCQYLMIDDTIKPFKKGMEDLERFETENKTNLYPLNLKALHFTIHGNFLHYHRDIDPHTYEESYVASNVFHPGLAAAVESIVSTRLFRMSQTNNTDAIRVDALTGKNLPVPSDFKPTGTGNMVFLTPSLKDKPGSTVYRDYIYRDRDKEEVVFKYRYRRGYKQACIAGCGLGKIYETTCKIIPLAGNRYMDNPPRRVGELLERSIKTTIPTIDRLKRERKEECQIDQATLDQYLRLFPKTLN